VALDVRRFRYFIAVAEEGQLTRAAQRLNMAQPALSQAIAQLERQLDVALLERHARGIRLTPAGEAFLVQARAAVGAFERAEAVARGWSEPRRDVIELGLPYTLLPRTSLLLGELSRVDPDVTVRARQLDYTELIGELRSGRVDAEMMCPPPPDLADLALQPINREQLFVFLAQSHRLAREPELRFEQIADERFVGPHPDMPEWWADAWLLTARRGRRPELSADVVRTADETVQAIASARGISVGPAFTAEQFDAVPGVATIPLVDVEPVVLAVARRWGDDRPALRSLFAAARRLAEDGGLT
jgi:DNA-binding transcriptional LysR family regulator